MATSKPNRLKGQDLRLTVEHGVALCPTLFGTEVGFLRQGWPKGIDLPPAAVALKQRSFRAALTAGVTISRRQARVVPGDNAREIEPLVEYGMTAVQALQAPTVIDAKVFHLDDRGVIAPGLLGDPDARHSHGPPRAPVMTGGEILRLD